jgi:hypothetical protein
MAENWFEIAQKMAEAARAGIIIERKRLEQMRSEVKNLPPQRTPASSR